MKILNLAAPAAILLMTGCATRPVERALTPVAQAPAIGYVTVGEIRLASGVAGRYSEPEQLLFVPMDMGGIRFEARLFHARGTQMALLEHHDRSTPLDLEGSFNRFGHARNAMRAWAKGLANGL